LGLSIDQLDDFIEKKEAKIAKLKPDNQSRIIWKDSLHQKTPYSVVYLHGFSASPMEADPIHFEFAKRYGCNLYLPRLAGHGIDDIESFKNLQPQDLVASAQEALEIGALIGEKVILMSCSTGGTLSVYLAATQPEKVSSMIMYSPNINIYDSKSNLLTAPWGLQLAKLIENSDYHSYTLSKEAEQYWTCKYRMEGVVCLRDLLNQTMTDEHFSKVDQPYFIGYYYKNDEESDHVISIDAIHDFYEKTATPENLKRKEAFPNVVSHVIASHFQSKDLDSVRKQTFSYAEEVLGLSPKK